MRNTYKIITHFTGEEKRTSIGLSGTEDYVKKALRFCSRAT